MFHSSNYHGGHDIDLLKSDDVCMERIYIYHTLLSFRRSILSSANLEVGRVRTHTLTFLEREALIVTTVEISTKQLEIDITVSSYQNLLQFAANTS